MTPLRSLREALSRRASFALLDTPTVAALVDLATEIEARAATDPHYQGKVAHALMCLKSALVTKDLAAIQTHHVDALLTYTARMDRRKSA